MTAAFVGQLSGEDPPRGDYAIRVDRVVWSVRSLDGVDGSTLSLAAVDEGSIIGLNAPDFDLEQGTEYVFVVSQSGFNQPDNPQYSAHVIYAGETLDKLEGAEWMRPHLNEILFPGERGNEAKLQALGELLAQAATFANGSRRGQPVPIDPASRLALARAARGERVPEHVDENLGETVAAYLSRGAHERQLIEFEDLPAQVISALNLRPLRAIIIHGTTVEYWAIGLRTSAGIVGPYVISDSQEFTEILSSRPASNGIAVVVWNDRPAPGEEVLASAVDLEVEGGPLVINDELIETASPNDVLVFELSGDSPSVRAISMLDADQLLLSLLNDHDASETEGP